MDVLQHCMNIFERGRTTVVKEYLLF